MADEKAQQQGGAADEPQNVALEIELRLDGVGPVGGIEPERVGSDGVLREGVDRGSVEEELLVMLEVGGGVAELSGVPLVPALGLVDEEGVVEAGGFASGEAAALFEIAAM